MLIVHILTERSVAAAIVLSSFIAHVEYVDKAKGRPKFSPYTAYTIQR